MKIRRAGLNDIERINEIYSDGIFDELKLQFPNKSRKIIESYAKEEILSHEKTVGKNVKSKRQYWIVILEKKKVIGFGSSYTNRKTKGVVESVYIDKQYRGKGYGVKILKHLVNWIKSKNVEHIESNLLTKNIPSKKLHEKAGFVPYLLRMRLK